MPQPFTVLTAIALPLVRDNVDTDAIIPSREMRSVSKTGLADGLFAGWRYLSAEARTPDPSFVMNQAPYAGARILLGGANFGCGSSREHAVWALAEFGFLAIIAPSFSPIFRNNCIRNGIAPVELAAARVAEIAAIVAEDPPRRPVTVDLEHRLIGVQGFEAAFEIDPVSREMLLAGLDPIDLTLREAARIAAFRRSDSLERPWAYLPPQPAPP